jgi:hypothetical protein
MAETAPAVKRYTLLDSVDPAVEKLKLPLAIMRDVGGAVQTLGGLLAVTNRETFAAVATIAQRARVPVPTCRKHLLTLAARGWLENLGRQHTRRGAPRRTSTIVVTKQTIDSLEPYSLLPWWACCSIRRVGRLPWSAKALLSVVLARLCALNAAIERQDGCGLNANNVEASIEAMGGDSRWRFSLRWLAQETGLSHDSITKAKRVLNHQWHLLKWTGQQKNEHGVSRETDFLIPNWQLVVQVTPAHQGGCFLDLGTLRDPHAKTG